MSSDDELGLGLRHQRQKGKTGRQLLANRLSRGPHQQEVDAVDIRAPSSWLHHEAMASFTLRREAQNCLQLWDQTNRRPKELSGVLNAVIAQAKSEGKVAGWREEEQAFREASASEVLPWGAWPVRLKNHDGRSFYSPCDTQNDEARQSDHFLVNRDEEEIHDFLLLPSQLLNQDASAENAATVIRLLPAEGGGWVEANSRMKALSPTTINSCSRADEDCKVNDMGNANAVGTIGRGTSCSAPPSPKVNRYEPGEFPLLAPGSYGGWIAAEKSTKRALRKFQAYRRTKTRYDGSWDTSTSDGNSLPLLAAVGGSTQDKLRGGRKRRRDDPDANGQLDARYRLHPEGRCGNGRERDGGDQPRRTNDAWQGWTVAEPVKEAVRRVWARARRRVEDACDPQLSTSPTGSNSNRNAPSHTTPLRCAPSSLDEGVSCETVASSNVYRGEPSCTVSSCLGRECEGLIDAALQVILCERLRSSATASAKASNVSDGDCSSRSSWEDVLKTMGKCAAKARANLGLRLDDADDDTSEAVDHRNSFEPMHGSADEQENAENEGLEGEVIEDPRDMGHVSQRSGGDPKAWGGGECSDGAVVVVNDRLPALPLNDAVLTRSYNRLLLYLHEKKSFIA